MDPQYKCEDCNSTFLEKKNYNKHMRNVHSEKKLECQHCQFKTNDNSSLKRHIITHENKEEPPAKKIKCDQCFKTFSDKFNLNKHVKNVHGEEMNCPHCNFKTRIQQTFTKHVNKCKKKVEIARKDKTSVQTPVDQVEVACDEQEQCLGGVLQTKTWKHRGSKDILVVLDKYKGSRLSLYRCNFYCTDSVLLQTRKR